MTTKLPPETYLQFWQKAEEQEFGICIEVAPDDQAKLMNALYECRQVAGGFEDMMIFQPLPAGQLFIVHKSAELP
jgi:hypothetical protein